MVVIVTRVKRTTHFRAYSTSCLTVAGRRTTQPRSPPKVFRNLGLALPHMHAVTTGRSQRTHSDPRHPGLPQSCMCLVARTHDVRRWKTTENWLEVSFDEIPLGFLRRRTSPRPPTIVSAPGYPKPEGIADDDLRPDLSRIAQIEPAFPKEPFDPLLKAAILTFCPERSALRRRQNRLAKPFVGIGRETLTFVGRAWFR